MNWKSQSVSQSLDHSQPTSHGNSRGASPAVNVNGTASPYPSAGNVVVNPSANSQTKSSTMTPQANPSANSQIPSISLSDVNKAKLLSKMNHIQFPQQQQPLQFGQHYNPQAMWQAPDMASGQWNQPGGASAPYDFQPVS